MNYRTTKLLAATDIGPAGTKTIDINVKEPISRIQLQWAVHKSVSYMMDYCHKDISKIELVDGSDVLFGMDGGQAQALNIYDRKCHSMNYGLYIGANDQYSYYGIDFGRYLWDPVLAFDPKRFDNPQLKVTYSEIISDTGGADGTLEVVAEIFDEKTISPMGFLMSKAHHSYTPGSDGSYEYVKMPTDHPYRKILVQGYRSGICPDNVIKAVKLSEDNDKRIPFDWEMWAYKMHRMNIDPPVFENFITQLEVTSRYYYVTPTDYWSSIILQGNDSTEAGAVDTSGEGGKIACSSAAGGEFNGKAHGYWPNHCFHFPFGDEKDIDDWYDVTKVGSLELRLRAGSGGSAGVGTVVIQQLRRY